MKRLVALLSAVVVGLAAPAQGAPCTDTEWLIKAYGDLVFRPPSQQELGAWVNAGLLVNGATRFEAAYAIATSFESSMDVVGGYPQTVSGLVQLVFGRDPQIGEAQALVNTLQFPNGDPAEQVLAYVIAGTQAAADEFNTYAIQQNPGIAACGPDRAVVNQLFHVYLGRNATVGELVTFSGFLANGTPLQTVATGVASVLDVNVGQGTYEFFNQRVTSAYQRFLRRVPGPNELVTMSQIFAQSSVEAELWALLLSQDEYCTGQPQQPAVAELPPVPANVQQLNAYVADTPPQYSVQTPQQPYQVSAEVQVLSLQQQVVAKDVAIARLSGGVVINPPPDFVTSNPEIISGATTSALSPAEVIASLTSEVGALSAQVAQQTGAIAALQQQVARQASTVDALVGVDFDQAVTTDAALAARGATLSRLQAASAVATGTAARNALQHGYGKFALGDAAIAGNDPAQALRDYEDAFKDAIRAERLGSR